MATQFSTNDIKLEGVDSSENVTEIQSYLEGFQKEIEGTDGPVQAITRKSIFFLHWSGDQFFFTFIVFAFTEAEGEENEGEGEEGTYFVDQAGHYYYQAKGETQPVMTVMPNLNDSGGDEGEEFIINQENEEEGEVTEEVRWFSLAKIYMYNVLIIIGRDYRIRKSKF